MPPPRRERRRATRRTPPAPPRWPGQPPPAARARPPGRAGQQRGVAAGDDLPAIRGLPVLAAAGADGRTRVGVGQQMRDGGREVVDRDDQAARVVVGRAAGGGRDPRQPALIASSSTEWRRLGERGQHEQVGLAPWRRRPPRRGAPGTMTRGSAAARRSTAAALVRSPAAGRPTIARRQSPPLRRELVEQPGVVLLGVQVPDGAAAAAGRPVFRGRRGRSRPARPPRTRWGRRRRARRPPPGCGRRSRRGSCRRARPRRWRVRRSAEGRAARRSATRTPRRSRTGRRRPAGAAAGARARPGRARPGGRRTRARRRSRRRPRSRRAPRADCRRPRGGADPAMQSDARSGSARVATSTRQPSAPSAAAASSASRSEPPTERVEEVHDDQHRAGAGLRRGG